MRKSLWRWLFSSLLLHAAWSNAAFAADAPRVLNPLGQPPAIERVPMAPRIDALAGKTIYLVDIGFTDTHQLFTEMRDLLAARYPDTTWEVRTKIGTYFDDDPELWAEIKQRGHGMVIGIGH
jgi:hypothetical protein